MVFDNLKYVFQSVLIRTVCKGFFYTNRTLILALMSIFIDHLNEMSISAQFFVKIEVKELNLCSKRF